MEEETCGLCGHKDQSAAVEIYHIVPKELTEQAGMPESQTIRLCSTCYSEAHTWCSIKVSDIVYDIKTKEFRKRSCLEMVKEYQSTFSSFVKYNKSKPITLPSHQWKTLIRCLRDYSGKILIRLLS